VILDININQGMDLVYEVNMPQDVKEYLIDGEMYYRIELDHNYLFTGSQMHNAIVRFNKMRARGKI